MAGGIARQQSVLFGSKEGATDPFVKDGICTGVDNACLCIFTIYLLKTGRQKHGKGKQQEYLFHVWLGVRGILG